MDVGAMGEMDCFWNKKEANSFEITQVKVKSFINKRGICFMIMGGAIFIGKEYI
jgi:hypothetical protein